ncbi:cilia- and flagella-associated protein 157-like [Argonauta hians]
MESDKREIVAYWKQQLKQKCDDFSDLTENFHKLQQAKQSEKEQFESQILNLENDLLRVKEELNAEITILNGKLAILEDFRIQRQELLAKFAKMEEDLKNMEETNKQTIYQLEKKQVIDKDKLKKDMFTRVNHLVAEFRKVSNKQMAETTKRTIRENVSLTAQMSKMSDKTMELIQENEGLKDKVRKMKNKIDVLEYNEKGITKKLLNCQKHVTLLTSKCQKDKEVITAMEQKEIEIKKKLKENENTVQQMEESEQIVKNAIHNSKEMAGKLQASEEKCQKFQTDNSTILEILQEASNSIRKYLLTLESDEETENLNELLLVHRDNMLKSLLKILNESHMFGLGPSVTELSNTYAAHIPDQKKPSHFPPIKAKLKKTSTAHYIPGDIGFVPRTVTKDPFQNLSGEYQVKGAGQSIGVQTLNLKRAIFFDEELLWKAFPRSKCVVPAELEAKPSSKLASPKSRNL